MPELLRQEYRNRRAFRTYLDFYAGYRVRLIGVAIMYLVKASPVFGIPIVTADIINLITARPGNLMPRLGWLGGIGFLLILQNIPTHILYVWMFSKINRGVELTLRSSLCTRLQQLSVPYHTNSKIGVLQTKVIRDVENIETLTRQLCEALPHVVFSIVIAVTVTAMRAPLFIFFYLATVPVAILLCRMIRSRMTERNREFRRSVEEMSGSVSEMLRLIPITRAHHVEETEIGRVTAKLENIRRTGLRLDCLNAVFNSTNWVMFNEFNIFTLILTAILYDRRILPIGIGDIVLLTTYFNTISGAVMRLMDSVPAVAKGLESVRSVGEVIECPDIEQNTGKPAVDAVRGEFRFEHVSFRYPGSDAHALADVSLTVAPGETIAFVGPSGAGKSTMAQLVIGFVRPTGGRLLLDGRDMNEIDLRSYRRFISVVTQETILFDGSIRDNIAYGIPDATDAQILEAVRYARLDDFVASLPEGLQTGVRENGARLSGGQKQRIAIARALLRNPRVLILDEATSALDVESEARIQDALDHLVAGRTTFMIAHRLSTVRNADRIVVFREGRIVEIGNHSELLAADGFYAEQYRLFADLN